MRFRSLVSVLIAILTACSIAALYARDASQPDPALDAQIADAFAQATAADKAAHPDQAARIYWSIVDRFPDHPESPRAAKQAAYATDKLKDRDQSIAAFKRALELYPDSGHAPALKRCLALNYGAKGGKDAAIAELKDLIARFPTSDSTCYGLVNLGLLYISKVGKQNTDGVNWKYKEEADAAFRRVAETFPNKRDLCAKAEMYRAGIAFERVLAHRSTWEIASEQIQGMLNSYADAPGGIKARWEIMLAEIAMENSDASTALQRAEDILKSYPDCKLEVGWSHYIAGNACESKEDYATALTHYSAIIDAKYTEADNFANRDITLYSLRRSADCYSKLGQSDKELEAWLAIIERYPDDPVVEIARASVARLQGGK